MGRLIGMCLCLVLAHGVCAGDYVGLARYGFDVSDGAPPLPPNLTHSGSFGLKGYRYHLIHLWQPMAPSVRDALTEHGLELVSYVPDNCYVVRVYRGIDLDTAPFVDWHGLWHPAYKLRAGLETAALRPGPLVLDITLHSGAHQQEAVGALRRLGGDILHEVDSPPVQHVTVAFADSRAVWAVAELEDVCWITETGTRRVRNDRARWLVQAYEGPDPADRATPIYDHGLHGEGEVLGLIDETVDIEHCLFRDPEDDPPGPNHRKIAYFQSAEPPADHGTHVAGTLAGVRTDALDGAGIAYEARIAFTVLPGNQSGNLFNILETHGQAGAAVHSNSWGENLGTAVDRDYTTDCADADHYSRLNEEALVVFACWNDSTFPLTPLLSPENALNVLAVGATEAGDVMFPEELAERHGSCAIGPVPLDLRRKPEIFAPGRYLSSAAHNTACDMVLKGGTSMATPVVSGSAALIRQYFREGLYPFGRRVAGMERVPTGALLKAMLLVGTVDMAEDTESPPGTYVNTPIPNDVEGWGRIHLDNALYFEGDARRLMVEEVRHAEGLSTGASETYSVRVLSADQPFQLCMVFTQPAGMPGTLTPVSNDLDLVVTSPTGVVYQGNVFGGGASLPGGSPDPRNNVEQVRLPTPEVGVYTVTVAGTAVNVDTQGFSLAMTGDIVPGDCAQVTVDAGEDVVLGCWGTPVVLGLGLPHGLEGSVSWAPIDGLDDPLARTPIATPNQTTTYEVTVTLPNGCIKTDQVTLTVPAMNLDEDGDLDGNDFNMLLPQWSDLGHNTTYDFSGEGLLEVRDYVLLLNCTQP